MADADGGQIVRSEKSEGKITEDRRNTAREMGRMLWENREKCVIIKKTTGKRKESRSSRSGYSERTTDGNIFES